MLLALYGLIDKYSLVRDQILWSMTVPTLNSTWSTCCVCRPSYLL